MVFDIGTLGSLGAQMGAVYADKLNESVDMGFLDSVGGAAALGGAIGLGADFLISHLQERELRKQYGKFAAARREAFFQTAQAINAEHFEQSLEAARFQDQTLRQMADDADLFQASAAANMVEGNSITAAAYTQRLQRDEVRNQIARRLQLLNASRNRQVMGAAKQASLDIMRAARELDGGNPLIGLLGGLAQTAGAGFRATVEID